KHLVLDLFPGEADVNPERARRAALISPHIAAYSSQSKLNGTSEIHDAFRADLRFSDRATQSGGASPQPGSPVTDPEPLDASARHPEATPEATLHHLVRHAYDIARDDADLRAFLAPDYNKDGFSTSFDGLRKRYPVRQQFAGFTVRGLPAEKKIVNGKLTRLGFSVE